ncbi:MAG TPA: selenium-dependent molybdenum cofactor biosynthesis protein YqeB, partial [Chloroflexota bacterium]|nr:selenium-dependent molybdenum cofactor biosynthesis protein YqeB [Chloroflexota bacterium]
LLRVGLRVAISEVPAPTAVRRTVSFSEAIFGGRVCVEGVHGTLVEDVDALKNVWDEGTIPVMVDPTGTLVSLIHPAVLIDARMRKQVGIAARELPVKTVALGPGLVAGLNADAVIETNRGPDLGRVIWSGSATANTHIPAMVDGHAADRVLRAPVDGCLRCDVDIGNIVGEEEPIGDVDGTPIVAPFRGLVRGLLRTGQIVSEGMKIGDIDPRLDPSLCQRVSEKALAVAGGAVEATLILLGREGFLFQLPNSSASTS